MKRMICVLLMLTLLIGGTVSALAETPAISDELFDCAKAALKWLSRGAYDKLVTALPYSDVSPSADEWESFATGCFSSLDDPQSDYAVAYWKGKAWKIAVPVHTPDSGDVEALVLLSEDGSSITGYAYSLWRTVSKEYQASKYVVWNEEYNGSTAVIVEVDE